MSEIIAAKSFLTLMLLCFTSIELTTKINIVAKNKTSEIIGKLIIIIFCLVIMWVMNSIFNMMGITSIAFVFTWIGVSLYLIWGLYKTSKTNIDKRMYWAFLGYTGIILLVTLILRVGIYKPWIKMNAIEQFGAIISGADPALLPHLLLNTAMFVPLGFFLVMLNPKQYGSIKYTVYGVLYSLCIESIQLQFSMGECDILDLIGNSVGMLVGILVGIQVSKAYKRNGKEGELW